MRWMLFVAILGGCSSACSSGAKHDDKAASTSAVPSSSPSAPASATKMPKVYLSTPQGDVAVAVEIVATPAQIERGLMYREHLPPDQGMLFLMQTERKWSFWMRNTLIPLDMIFIKRDLTIAGIVENAEPRTETLREVNGSSSYVLEVNGGYCAAHKVVAGSKVRFEGVPPS